MLHPIKQYVRRRLKVRRHAREYPVLLPHFTADTTGLRSAGGTIEAFTELIVAAQSCDGTHTLREVAAAANVRPIDMVALHDAGAIIFWPEPVSAEPRAVPQQPAWVILSPHLDDAALCCTGLMLNSDDEAPGLVANVFTRTPWWRWPAPADVAEVNRTRLAEDHLVSRLAGTAHLNLDLPEALLRGYPIGNIFTAEPSPADREVMDQLAQTLARLAAASPEAEWYLPLCVGGHIDHRVVRVTALETLAKAGVPHERIFFYEDLPYSANVPGSAPLAATNFSGATLVSEDRILDADTRIKRELLSVYHSQLDAASIQRVCQYAEELSRESESRAVDRFIASSPRERVWRYSN